MDESRWENLTAGYRVPYDPRPAINRLRVGDTSAWDELWQELHHQGDVGVASYAAVPLLIDVHRERDVADWNTFALIGCIENCRGDRRNPPLPDWLAAEYRSSWDNVTSLACRDLPRATDETTVQSIIGAVALAKGIRPLGGLILDFTADELSEIIEKYRGG